MESHRILLTNDDGIESPGLKAAVEAVLNIGTVTVVAPSNQQSGAGRSLTGDMQSRLTRIDYSVGGKKIEEPRSKLRGIFDRKEFWLI